MFYRHDVDEYVEALRRIVGKRRGRWFARVLQSGSQAPDSNLANSLRVTLDALISPLRHGPPHPRYSISTIIFHTLSFCRSLYFSVICHKATAFPCSARPVIPTFNSEGTWTTAVGLSSAAHVESNR